MPSHLAGSVVVRHVCNHLNLDQYTSKQGERCLKTVAVRRQDSRQMPDVTPSCYADAVWFKYQCH